MPQGGLIPGPLIPEDKASRRWGGGGGGGGGGWGDSLVIGLIKLLLG